MGFDLDREQRRQLGYRLIDRINEYFSSLKDRPVQPPLEQRQFPAINAQPPETGQDAMGVLDAAIQTLTQQGFHIPSANYFGLTNPTPTYMAVLAEALVAAMNPQLASVARSQTASTIEHETVGWIAARVGWEPDKFGGTFTTGGTEANLSALALALAQRYPNAADDGIAGLANPPVVYASAEAHHSLEKSLALLGLGRKSLRRIPVTVRAEINPDALQETLAMDEKSGFAPLAIVGTAGTTSSGAIDSLPQLAQICREHNLWFHVDAAFGGALIFSDHYQSLLTGIDLADSITIDPHKWLAMPFAAGVLLTRHRDLLETTFGLDTNYLPRTSNPLPDNFRISTQWSRRMNSLKLWMTLQAHGRQGYEEMIDNQMALAELLEARVLATGLFAAATPRCLTILNFRACAAEDHQLNDEQISRLHREIVEEFTRDGQQWISTTRVAGHSVIRMMVINYMSERRHAEALAARLKTAAETVLQRWQITVSA